MTERKIDTQVNGKIIDSWVNKDGKLCLRIQDDQGKVIVYYDCVINYMVTEVDDNEVERPIK